MHTLYSQMQEKSNDRHNYAFYVACFIMLVSDPQYFNNVLLVTCSTLRLFSKTLLDEIPSLCIHSSFHKPRTDPKIDTAGRPHNWQGRSKCA